MMPSLVGLSPALPLLFFLLSQVVPAAKGHLRHVSSSAFVASGGPLLQPSSRNRVWTPCTRHGAAPGSILTEKAEDLKAPAREEAEHLDSKRTPWRTLGSFERLLTRQTVHDSSSEGGKRKLSIPHVSAAVVDGPLDLPSLASSMTQVIARQPVLRACIKGTGKVVNPAGPGLRVGGQEPDPLRWTPMDLPLSEICKAAMEVVEVTGDNASALDVAWQSHFQMCLDDTRMDLAQGPLWRLTVFRSATIPQARTVLVFAFDHGISDQISANNVIAQLLSGLVATPSSRGTSTPPQRTAFPTSIEEAITPDPNPNWTTFRYLLRQALLGTVGAILLPEDLKRNRLSVAARDRTTRCQFRLLDREVTSGLGRRCRERGLTITAALAAAMLVTVSDFAHRGDDQAEYWYKFLLSLNMRAFYLREEDRLDEALACAGGAMDFLARLQANSGQLLLSHQDPSVFDKTFWPLAQLCRKEYLEFVKEGFVPESVRLFDMGMKAVEILEVVEKEADNPKTLGRAYSCGVSNMGVFRHDVSYSGPSGEEVRLQSIYYATSHSLTGSLYQLSCGTVGGALCLTFQFPFPMVSLEAGQAFASRYCEILTKVCMST